MAFDWDQALSRVNVAIARILQPGWIGGGIHLAISELSSADLADLPKGEAKDAFEDIFAAVRAVKPGTMSEAEAEEIATRIWVLRSRLEKERRAFRTQALDQEASPRT